VEERLVTDLLDSDPREEQLEWLEPDSMGCLHLDSAVCLLQVTYHPCHRFLLRPGILGIADHHRHQGIFLPSELDFRLSTKSMSMKPGLLLLFF